MARRNDSDPLPPELERLGAELQAATTRAVDDVQRRRRRQRGVATVIAAGLLAAIVVPAQLGSSVHIGSPDDNQLIALTVPATLSSADPCMRPRSGGPDEQAGRCQWRDALGDPLQAAVVLSVRPN